MITLYKVTMTKNAKHVDHLPWGLQHKSRPFLHVYLGLDCHTFEQIDYRRLEK